MSTPPAMTKTTTSATTMRARGLLTRILLLFVMARCSAPTTDCRSLEGGRSSPVEAGRDRVVGSQRLRRKLPGAQGDDVSVAPVEGAGAEREGGERRPQSRAEPPQGERPRKRDGQLACRA